MKQILGILYLTIVVINLQGMEIPNSELDDITKMLASMSMTEDIAVTDKWDKERNKVLKYLPKKLVQQNGIQYDMEMEGTFYFGQENPSIPALKASTYKVSCLKKNDAIVCYHSYIIKKSRKDDIFLRKCPSPQSCYTILKAKLG